MKHQLACLPLLVLALLVMSNGFFVNLCLAQQTAPSVPKFTVTYDPNAVGVPPNYGIDMSTGKNVTMNGYEPTKRAVIFSIENPAGEKRNMFYNFRFKVSTTDKWSYYPFMPDGQSVLSYSGYSGATGDLTPEYPASNSDYTRVAVALNIMSRQNIAEDAEIDFQVQTLIGDIEPIVSGLLAGNHYQFTGETSNWSNSQTITLEAHTPTPSPQLTVTITPNPTSTPFRVDWEQITLIVLVCAVASLTVAVGLLWHKTTQKTPM
jgi:hypothetical protein